MRRFLLHAVAGALPAFLIPVAHAADAAAADWPSYNRTLEGDRFAPQTAVTPATAGRLKLACKFDLGRQDNFQTGPLMQGGTLYLTTALDTIALDAATCALKWRATESYKPAGPLVVNRGAALADGRIVRGTQDGRVIAYDAATGRRAWATRIADPARGETVPAAPIAWHGLVFVGNAGGDNKGVKGRMLALDAATGRVVWEQFLVPRENGDLAHGPAAPAQKLPAGGWSNAADVPVSGGATWTSYTLDTATGTLYVPAGNPAPDFVRALRPGANPHAGSVVALDARTGAVRSAWPLVERDFHDWDVSAAPVVFTSRAGKRIVAAAIKDGHLHALDAAAGRPLYKVPVTTLLNENEPLTPRGTRFCPGTQGGTEWNGPAFSPATNLLYVGAVDWCTTVQIAAADQVKATRTGQAWSGSASEKEPFGKLDPTDRWAGWLTAVDADSGKVAWKHKFDAPVLGGVTATAGGVVLAGDMAGHLAAFDANDGRTLWETDTGGAIAGGIIGYATAAGEQRIAVATGMTSPIWPTAKVNAMLLVYGL